MNEIVKIINCMAGRYQPRQIFQDWIKMFALSMSNSFYFDNKLENEYLDIAKKYTNDQLNVYKFNSHSKKRKKIDQRSAQLWLIIALLITLLLSAMNMCILSMYMDMFEQAGERFEQIFKEGY